MTGKLLGMTAFLAFFAGGCTLYGPWKASQEPVILIDGQSAKSVERTRESTFWMDPDKGEKFIEFAWADRRGHKYMPIDLVSDAADFLRGTEIYKTWPGTNSFVNSVPQLLAPFWFTLVSANPTVVILQPHDYGPPTGRSIYETVGAPNGGLYVFGLLNYLYYGTRLPKSSELWWFSPDLKQPPQRLPLQPDGNTAVIPAAKLRIIRTADGWEVLPLTPGAVSAPGKP